ncbi:MAG: hypothetical protein QOI41_588 [Myxococcales bacterium]|nr:hypothetical protein [Myxococcales bacterium]
MSAERCLMTARVDRHFSRTLDPADERAMREHLPTCAQCRARYEKQLLLERLDPDAAAPEARIASGLGIGRARPMLRAAPFMGALALAAAIAFLVLRPAGPGSPLDTGFTARGGGDASTSEDAAYVIVLRGATDAGPTRAGASIHRNDELTFSYGNGAGKRYLIIYGVDEHRHVFWYYPAWSDPKEDPHSIAIAPGAQSLPDAVKHDLDGKQLEIHAVFTDSPLSVKSVESLISSAPIGKTPTFGPGSIDRTIRFEVDP